jgi:hypothetical protein
MEEKKAHIPANFSRGVETKTGNPEIPRLKSM